MPLTARQQRFVAEYLVDLNATAASVRAGYSAKTAPQQGPRLLQHPTVAKEISAALERRSARLEIKADDVLRELLRLARVDIGEAFDDEGKLKPLKEIPEDVRRAISGIEVDELFDGHGENRMSIGVTRKLKFWDKTRALEMLGKHLKLFTDRIEVSGKLTLEQLLSGEGEK
jgi:phage terminase small subunit